jgi:hypothetical protein
LRARSPEKKPQSGRSKQRMKKVINTNNAPVINILNAAAVADQLDRMANMAEVTESQKIARRSRATAIRSKFGIEPKLEILNRDEEYDWIALGTDAEEFKPTNRYESGCF